MKTVIYLILGIILAIATLRLSVSAIILIANFHILSAAISGGLAYVAGILCGKCFNRL